MEQKEQPIEGKRKRRVFDVRLIEEIVRAVENGLPRKEAVRIYGMAKGTMDEWMCKYGSADYQAAKKRNYSPSQKRSILRAIESGMTTKEARIAFGMKSSSVIRGWLSQIKRKNADISSDNPTFMAPKDPKLPPSDEVRALQKALAEAELRNKALETLIDVAEETLKIDIRKKPGARQSPK